MVQYLLEPKLESTPRFREELDAQLAFLRRSVAAFDNGDEREAKQQALILRKLLHHNPAPKSNIKALLHTLGILESLPFVDSAIYRDRLNLAIKSRHGREPAGVSPYDVGLVEHRAIQDGRGKICPTLRERRFHPKDPRASAIVGVSQYNDWWTKNLIETSDRSEFSRKTLVCGMADQDGGAHVDVKLEEKYEAFLTDNLGVGVLYGAADKDVEPLPLIGSPVNASIRQIAFEVLLTLERFLISKKGSRYNVTGQPLSAITSQHLNPDHFGVCVVDIGPIVIQ